MPETPPPPLVLASSSIYRRTLLSRLTPCFDCASPEIDESRKDGETIRSMTERLAAVKARALEGSFPCHLIIGSDQSAAVDETQLHKPGNHQRAFDQLSALSGRTVNFYTSVAVLDSRSGNLETATDITEVTFRDLDRGEIMRYLDREAPYDCAGSFKVEGLGISLFTRVRNDDPTALVGLPLLQLAAILRRFGLPLP